MKTAITKEIREFWRFSPLEAYLDGKPLDEPPPLIEQEGGLNLEVVDLKKLKKRTLIEGDPFVDLVFKKARWGYRTKITESGKFTISIKLEESGQSLLYNFHVIEENVKADIKRKISNKEGNLLVLNFFLIKRGSTLKLNDHIDIDRATSIIEDQFLLEGNSKLEITAWMGGGEKLKHTRRINLNGDGSKTQILEINESRKQSNHELNRIVTHLGKATESYIETRGIVSNSKSLHHGLVKIVKGASHSKSHLKSHHLILDRGGRGSSIPKLEIDEEEVEAGHGATLSKLNEEEIYYLMTRGLSRRAARSLIIKGFKEELFKRGYKIEL